MKTVLIKRTSKLSVLLVVALFLVFYMFFFSGGSKKEENMDDLMDSDENEEDDRVEVMTYKPLAQLPELGSKKGKGVLSAHGRSNYREVSG